MGGTCWGSDAGAYLLSRLTWLIEKITVSGITPHTLKATQDIGREIAPQDLVDDGQGHEEQAPVQRQLAPAIGA